jgi:hypothetical protein
MRWADLRRPGAGATLAAVASLATVASLLTWPAAALAASPAPSAVGAGDPRSVGQGPGLVGDPMTALLVVVAIGVLSLAATLAYVRFTGGGRRGGS